MDADRSRHGALGALLGFVGGYVVAYWQGRSVRRALALLRLVQRGSDDALSADMKARLEALDKGKAP